jgi:hypothetical protein
MTSIKFIPLIKGQTFSLTNKTEYKITLLKHADKHFLVNIYIFEIPHRGLVKQLFDIMNSIFNSNTLLTLGFSDNFSSHVEIHTPHTYPQTKAIKAVQQVEHMLNDQNTTIQFMINQRIFYCYKI